MKVIKIKATGNAGVTIELSNQQLRMLKDTWLKLVESMTSAEDGVAIADMNYFMNQVYGDVESTDNVRESLFGKRLIVEDLTGIKHETRINKRYRELHITLEEYCELAAELGFMIEPRPTTKVSMKLHGMIADLHGDKITAASMADSEIEEREMLPLHRIKLKEKAIGTPLETLVVSKLIMAVKTDVVSSLGEVISVKFHKLDRGLDTVTMTYHLRDADGNTTASQFKTYTLSKFE